MYIVLNSQVSFRQWRNKFFFKKTPKFPDHITDGRRIVKNPRNMLVRSTGRGLCCYYAHCIMYRGYIGQRVDKFIRKRYLRYTAIFVRIDRGRSK